MPGGMRTIGLIAVVTACSTPPPAARGVARPDHAVGLAPAPAVEPSEPATLDERFVGALREAGAAYPAWGRVDERPNIAPGLCRMPMKGDYGVSSHARLSGADDAPHGRKLYYLWASDRWQYLSVGEGRAVPVGFAIVKESFAARATPVEPTVAPGRERAGSVHALNIGWTPPPVDRVEASDGTLYVGAPTGLYIMTKVAADAADGTDAGWVYGTIAADGTVTSAGRVERCMACHDDTEHERLFGLQPTKVLVEPYAPPSGLGP